VSSTVDALSNNQLLASAQSHASAEFVADLELLESRVMPLPGAVVPRPWEPDSRILLPLGSKSTDLIALYEHVATVRHRSSKKIYVVARETIDCLHYQQQDPAKFPRWIMQLEEKKAELRIFFFRVKNENIVRFRALGNTGWWPQWLEDVGSDAVHDSLTHYLLHHKRIRKEIVERRGR